MPARPKVIGSGVLVEVEVTTITPHSDFSDLWQRLDRRNSNPDALADPTACRDLAEASRQRLKVRLQTENCK